MPRATRSASRNPDAEWTPSASRKYPRAKSTSSEDSTDNVDAPIPKRLVATLSLKPFATNDFPSRQARAHTGEKKFHCPFPGCDTSTSRKDNLNQHYRIQN
ncbi:hypothetical protein DL96DRAFT_696857 [Flagelloscypha sp. PMI_526]|nr:hypothetical protein DL96DRAFT_696857 [Flagelloscypha sp. PMI_526]